MINENQRQRIVANINTRIAGAYEQIAALQDEIKSYREDIAEQEEERDLIERMILINSN